MKIFSYSSLGFIKIVLLTSSFDGAPLGKDKKTLSCVILEKTDIALFFFSAIYIAI